MIIPDKIPEKYNITKHMNLSFGRGFLLSVCDSKKVLCLLIIFVLSIVHCEAIELRAIIEVPESACEGIMRQHAVYRGDYAFTDYIYINKQTNTLLNDEYLRIREYQLTRWQQKAVVVVYKIRNPHKDNHQILFQYEFDTLEEAKQIVPSCMGMQCSFFRHGWEYLLENMRIFVEEIENLPPSIEVIAPSQEEILSLFDTLGVIEILHDSVPEWYCKSNPLSIN